MMIRSQSPPKLVFFPIARHSHHFKRYCGMSINQLHHPARPLAVRGDSLHQVTAHAEHGEDSIVLNDERFVPIGHRMGWRNFRAKREHAVVQAAVVSAVVSDGVQDQEPGLKRHGGHTEFIGDLLSDVFGALAIQRQRRAQ